MDKFKLTPKRGNLADGRQVVYHCIFKLFQPVVLTIVGREHAHMRQPYDQRSTIRV